MDTMIPSLNKSTLQNQRKTRRKYNPRHFSNPEKKVQNIPSDRSEKKNENSFLSKSHLALIGLLSFAGIFSLTSFLSILNLESEHFLWLRLLVSSSISILIISVAIHLQIRKITSQVDVLCRHFVKYRRECETDELEVPESFEKRTLMEQRVMMLQELWKRFQSMQNELSHNVGELEFSKQQLEQTISDLQKAKEQEKRLVELGHAVAEFGHDIRNANGSIASFANLLTRTFEKNDITPMDLMKAVTYIRHILNSSNNVSGLTTDILDFAAGKMEIRSEQFELEDFQGQLESQLGFIGEIPLYYRVPSGQSLFALRLDGRKITRVLVNLVKNAWEKFHDDPVTQDGKEPSIEIRFIPMSGSDLKIQIMDNGHPINDEILPRLFQAFQTEGKEKGTGLGLSICRQLIEAHGGSINGFNLADNQGVAFELWLPNCVMASSRKKQLAPRKELAILS